MGDGEWGLVPNTLIAHEAFVGVRQQLQIADRSRERFQFARCDLTGPTTSGS